MIEIKKTDIRGVGGGLHKKKRAHLIVLSGSLKLLKLPAPIWKKYTK